MGNRGSIQVICPERPEWGRKSVVLFRHWRGDEKNMLELCKRTKKVFTETRGAPPYNQVNEIIALMTALSFEEIGTSTYLGKDENDGDNSNNGHFILEVHGEDKPGDWFLITPEKKRILI